MFTEMKPKDQAILDGGSEPPIIVKEILARLASDIDPDSILMELGGSYHQRRCGYLKDKYVNYFPVNLSLHDMAHYAKSYQRIAVASDAAEIPIADASVDCVFTHNFLEHPTNPRKVVKEIIRTVKPGGIVVHCDAWHCRWWQRYGVVGIKQWTTMSRREKTITLAAKISELPLIRMPRIILRRMWREIQKPLSFKYVKLQPNYDLKLGSDEDAASSIDPVDLLRFYQIHGFRHDPHLSLLKRLFFKNQYLYLVRNG